MMMMIMMIIGSLLFNKIKNTKKLTPITFRIVMNYDLPRCGRGLEFRSLLNNSVFNENFGRG